MYVRVDRIRQGPPRSGAALDYYQMVRLFFRHEEQIETLVRARADPVVVHADRGREIGVGLQESARFMLVRTS